MRIALGAAGVDAHLKPRDGGATRVVSLFQGEGHFKRSVQFLNLGASQGPNEAGQLHLAETPSSLSRPLPPAMPLGPDIEECPPPLYSARSQPY